VREPLSGGFECLTASTFLAPRQNLCTGATITVVRCRCGRNADLSIVQEWHIHYHRIRTISAQNPAH
jgi:hypothetical protein